jgi:HK97 family phage major capsid protein
MLETGTTVPRLKTWGGGKVNIFRKGTLMFIAHQQKEERLKALNAADAILKKAETEKRELTADEAREIDVHTAKVKQCSEDIAYLEANNTLAAQFDLHGPMILLGGGPDPDGASSSVPGEHPKATTLRAKFGTWMKNQAARLAGTPRMEAASETGVVSVGSGSGLDSVSFSVPLEILPYLKSYFALDSFGNAGATVISTDHMREINLPIIAAGALPSNYAESQGPVSGASGSQPFGMSGFTFGANKYSRQVIASYEALQSTEVPLQPMIIDELLASMANVMTSVATTALYGALTSPPGIGSSGNPLLVAPDTDTYSSMIALRHAVPPRYDLPTNKWMLSRATLAAIRNTKASTSGVPMFDPNTDLIFGRPYSINDYFDAAFGAGAVVYGSWKDGAYLRRTPLLTRVLDQLYWLNNDIGYLATQWGDNHFLAELSFAAQPPSNQPLYYTTLSSEATS